MRFRTYILLSATILWFIFGSLFMYRSFWDLDNLKSYSNAIEEFGIKELKEGQNQFAFTFKLQGKLDVFGYHKKKEINYLDFTKTFKIGDTATVYYGDWKIKNGEINTQIYNLKVGKSILIDHQNSIDKDRKIAGILYLISACLGGITLYLFRKKTPTRPAI